MITKKTIIISLLALLLVCGGFLRSYQLGAQSYWIDEGYTLNAVLSTLEKGVPILDSGELYGKYYLLPNYLITASVLMGGFNPIAARLPAVLFGLGTIVVVYLLGKQYFGARVGLFAAALTTFSYWEITWSRQARMYIELQFFFLLSLYLFNSLLDKFSYKKLTALALTTSATILSHYFGYFLPVIYLIILSINFSSNWKEKINEILKDKKKAALAGTIAMIFAALAIKLGIDFFSQLHGKKTFIGINYQHFLWEYLPLITVGALAGAIIAIIEEKKSKRNLGLVLTYLVPYLAIVFTAKVMHFRYLFFVMPVLFILTGYLACFVADKFKRPIMMTMMLLIAIIIGSNLLSNETFVFKPQSHYYLEPHTPQPNFSSAYKAIKENGWNDDKVIISAFTQLDKVYLGHSDYWLAIDLNGGPLNKAILKEREFYNNSITVADEEKLAEVIAANSGYIVVDDMAKVRLSEGINNLIAKQKLIYTNFSNSGDRIWVFAF